ncbi:hypothetical protein MMC28_010334 [Mycoblastus sanguinarius]|nr:hypothetical protein [Mycoblastus sanguinarius]
MSGQGPGGRGRGDAPRGRGQGRGNNPTRGPNQPFGGGTGRGRGDNPPGGPSQAFGGGAGRGRGDNPPGGSGQAFGGGAGRGRGRGAGGEIFAHKGDPIPQPNKDVTVQENKVVASNQELSLGGLSLSSSRLPPRPGYGTEGRGIILRTNYFAMITNSKARLYKYNVDIKPDPEESKRKRRRIMSLLLSREELRSNGNAVASDYAKTLIAAKELRMGKDGDIKLSIKYLEVEESVPRPNATTYAITISLTGTVVFRELMDYLQSTASDQAASYDKGDAIQAMNIVMARFPNISSDVYPSTGNKFFPYPTKKKDYKDLGEGLIAVRGYYASVRTSTLRALVNINAQTSAFYPECDVKTLMDLHGGTSQMLENFISKLRVRVTHLKNQKGEKEDRVKTIYGFSHPPQTQGHAGNSVQIKFQCDAVDPSKPISVQEYFAKQYGISLKSPQAACLNVGTKTQPRYIPPELCDVVPGQVFRRKLSDRQTAVMITYAAQPPAVNADKILNEGLAVMGVSHPDNNDAQNEIMMNKTFSQFGLKVLGSMLTVPGRILVSPVVKYRGSTENGTGGSWNMIKKTFTVPIRTKDWSFMTIGQATIGAAQISAFQTALRSYGLGDEKPKPPRGFQANLLDAQGRQHEESIDRGIDRALNQASKEKVKILLVVLPSVHTVCSVGSKLSKEKGQPQYCANVALKFNLKCGGVNQSLPDDKLSFLNRGDCMVVGIDVTHPSPGSIEGAPSIAGVVASIDSQYAQFPASIRAQKSRQEMVQYLQDMVEERLKLWQKKNRNAFPANILVYRDGVSEGQYETVLTEELPAFKKAFEKLYPVKQQPKLTIIIVGKRHHTRFFPTNPKDADPKTGNPMNGTVVDRGVTMEKGWDFFLQAHTALQGTARPAHYVIVHDEMKLGANQLEQVTHSLCYLFGRATKAVSICPPAYYADLLCERGRCYLNKALNADVGSVGSGVQFNWNASPWVSGVHRK